MNEYNFSIDHKFRITLEAKTEVQATKKVKAIYPEAESIELMAIIIKSKEWLT
jgi:hypothetical protein